MGCGAPRGAIGVCFSPGGHDTLAHQSAHSVCSPRARRASFPNCTTATARRRAAVATVCRKTLADVPSPSAAATAPNRHAPRLPSIGTTANAAAPMIVPSGRLLSMSVARPRTCYCSTWTGLRDPPRAGSLGRFKANLGSTTGCQDPPPSPPKLHRARRVSSPRAWERRGTARVDAWDLQWWCSEELVGTAP